MKDLSNVDKQIEIFCAFIIDFSKIKATVSKMMVSNKESELDRVAKIHEIVSSFISDTTSADDLLVKLNIESSEPRINHLLTYVKNKLNTNKEDSYNIVLAHYKSLTKITRPKAKIVIDEIDNDLIIKADPSVPISTQDLNFLNKIAKLSVNNTAEIREANKDFKSLNFKNKLDELYCSKAYYFEQVFANTDVQIQRKLLDILKERQNIRKPKQEEIEALNSLLDINTLTDIDTLTIKTSSNVSDHQAFEAFSKILKKNSNPNIIKKVLKENIIMTAMFKTNSTTISPYYGLKKLFISAVYPYNEVIIKRYMQLLEVDEFELAEIISSLCSDPEFKSSYNIYQKGQETKLFLDFAENTIAEISLNEVNEMLINKLVQVIKGFINRESYSYFIFSQDYMFRILSDIYYYVINNDLYNNTDLIDVLKEYLHARTSLELNAKNNPYFVDSNTIVFGIIPADLWFDIHRIISDYSVDWIDKFYLKYNEIDILTFTPHNKLEAISEDIDASDLKYLADKECMILCSESGSKNFDMYLYDVFTRIAKGIFNSRFKFTIRKTEGSAFRKKQLPGLIKTDETKLRKAFIDFLTFKILSAKDSRYFAQVYRRKISSVLKNFISIEASFDEIKEYVSCEGFEDLLLIFQSKDAFPIMLQKATRYETNDDDSLIMKHSEDFFNLLIK